MSDQPKDQQLNEESKAWTRRDFLKRTALGAVATSAALQLTACESEAAQAPAAAQTPATTTNGTAKIPMRTLGKTGVQVSMLGFGGGSRFLTAGANEKASEERAIAQLERAVKLGINYFDTAESYGRDRKSERLYGLGLAPFRNQIFLATKSTKRTYDGMMRTVEESLKFLKTDHLDLMQMHEVGRRDDPAKWEQPDGALTALRKLKEQKVVRFIGFTGHDNAEVHKRVIEMYDYDTVLMALNASEHHPFREVALPAAQQKNMGIIGMKAIRNTAGNGKAAVPDLLAWAWEQPISTVIIGMEGIEQLEENVRLAREWKPGQINTAQLTEELRPHVTAAQLGWALPHYRDSFV
jgi:predicted aldo/keto reductase-like oxidoreductase